MKCKYILLFLVLVICQKVFSQPDPYQEIKKKLQFDAQGISMGLQASNYIYGELGYFKSNLGGFPIVTTTMNYGIEFSYFDKLILAPKVMAKINLALFSASLSALFYSDLSQQYSIQLRPEVGIGLWFIDINYGYNFRIYNHEFQKTNTHLLSLRYYLDLKTRSHRNRNK